MRGSSSLPEFGSPNEQQRRRRQQERDDDILGGHGMSSSSQSALPTMSAQQHTPETSPLRPLNDRVLAEQERQRLLGVFSSLSTVDLQRRLERYATLLSPHLSTEGFRAMVRDLPKPVLVRTLADVVRQAPQYGQ